MTISNKQSLVHYLEFLKENGFLFVETDTPEASAAEPALEAEASPAVTAPAPAPRKQAHPKAPAAAPAAPAPDPPAFAPPAPGQELSREERLARLADGAARAEACRACALGAQRNKLVYADGDPMARIVFVGEAPGGEEDRQGLPFVGPAGQLLNKMIAAIGFKREEVFICNTLKCRPPENRDPLPAEKAACEHFLLEQLAILRPQMLVALGAHSAHYLCHSEESIGRLRGRWHDYNGIPVLATYHPAFLLRNESFKPKSWEDFQRIHALYTKLNPDEPRAIWRKKEKA